MKDLSIKKLYYSISEVSKITEVEQYVLRYWETEFDTLKPQKNRAGNRIYTNKDIQLVIKIKSLLRDKKYTIEGAKKILEELDKPQGIVKPIELSLHETLDKNDNNIENNVLGNTTECFTEPEVIPEIITLAPESKVYESENNIGNLFESIGEDIEVTKQEFKEKEIFSKAEMIELKNILLYIIDKL